MPDDPAAHLPERPDPPGPASDGGESPEEAGKDPAGQESGGQREDARDAPEAAEPLAASGTTPAHRPEAAGGADQTRPLAAAGGDETRPLAATGGEDRTRPVGAAGGADQTRPLAAARGDETRPLAATGGEHETRSSLTPPAGPARPRENWSGRARVPTRPAAGGAGGSWAEQADWEQQADEDRGHWWMPIVVGLVGFLLIGMLTVGIWLISTAQHDEPGKGTPTAPATAPPTAAHPTSAPPRTTAAPSPAPEPSPIILPDLVGVSVEEAEARLEHLGLTYRVTYQPSFEEPGTVLSTAPEAGTDVEAGAEVVLSVAQPLLPTEQPTTPG